MSLFTIKKGLVGLSVALMIVLFGSSETNAQSRREIERERQRVERENARWERERQRQPTVTRREVRRFENAYFAGGYEQGYLAGTKDRRAGKYNRSNVYRGTSSYPNAGDPTNTDFIYRQGYLTGYDDGFHGRANY